MALAGAAAHGASQLLQELHCPLNHPGTADTTGVHAWHAARGSLQRCTLLISLQAPSIRTCWCLQRRSGDTTLRWHAD